MTFFWPKGRTMTEKVCEADGVTNRSSGKGLERERLWMRPRQKERDREIKGWTHE